MTVYQAEQTIWNAAAEALGWEWKPAYNGYVRQDFLKPGTTGSQWSDYPSDIDGEDACFIDGVETLDRAREVISEAAATV